MSLWWHNRRGSKPVLISVGVPFFLIIVLLGIVLSVIVFALSR